MVEPYQSPFCTFESKWRTYSTYLLWILDLVLIWAQELNPFLHMCVHMYVCTIGCRNFRISLSRTLYVPCSFSLGVESEFLDSRPLVVVVVVGGKAEWGKWEAEERRRSRRRPFPALSPPKLLPSLAFPSQPTFHSHFPIIPYGL